MKDSENRAIAVCFKSEEEARVFEYLSGILLKSEVGIPKIFDFKDKCFLCEDAGEDSLFKLSEKKADKENTITLYKKALELLYVMQTRADCLVDYSRCRPVREFDYVSVMWDLDYFKYLFLKIFGLKPDEYRLENEFKKLASTISEISEKTFVHRDFQSRNIYFKGSKILLIDYTGARRGPAHYDLASLLFQTRADLSDDIVRQMLDCYIDLDKKKMYSGNFDFLDLVFSSALFRILQNLGAYGFRGYHGQNPTFKTHIKQAVQKALKLAAGKFPEISLNLEKALEKAVSLTPETSPGKLKVRLKSFSYKKGIPRDLSVHGGGFVFDCRSLPNPGRFQEFQNLTGKDVLVSSFLKREKKVRNFLEYAENIIKLAVDDFLSRKFELLDIYFGCTGGVHRSVFCAEELKRSLESRSCLAVELNHTELDD
ncbi:phosphotransferase [candidate division WOR-3 bacterium]|nr:phosphotransferase [candidate division WOR-3 bacterium]